MTTSRYGRIAIGTLTLALGQSAHAAHTVSFWKAPFNTTVASTDQHTAIPRTQAITDTPSAFVDPQNAPSRASTTAPTAPFRFASSPAQTSVRPQLHLSKLARNNTGTASPTSAAPRTLVANTPAFQDTSLKPRVTVLHQQSKLPRVIRYKQYYKGLPVIGYQLIAHRATQRNSDTTFSGQLVSQVGRDIPTTTPALRMADARRIALQAFHNEATAPGWTTKPPAAHLSVYKPIRPQDTPAKLIYYVTIFAHNQSAHDIRLMVYYIDANTGEIIQQWNNIKTVSSTGPGGTNKTQVSGYPSFAFNYAANPGANQFGPLSVKREDGNCYLENDNILVYDNRQNWGYTDFLNGNLQVLSAAQQSTSLGRGFSYSCSSAPYQNPNDADKVLSTNAPCLQGRSPNNDAYFFSNRTIDAINMYTNLLKTTNPLKASMSGNPAIPVITHITNYANAFAVDAIYFYTDDDGNTVYTATPVPGAAVYSYPQLIIGDGNQGNTINNDMSCTINPQPPGPTLFYPLTSLGVIAHELGHLLTNANSQLIYADESGGINEAFSDIMATAVKEYVKSQYNSWYNWGNDLTKEFTIGISITDAGYYPLGLRQMYQPSLDGCSVDTAAEYDTSINTCTHYKNPISCAGIMDNCKMNPHYSSGVFNHAAYLIGRDIGVQKMFEVFLYANQLYWLPNSTFDYAACGVIQAASDLSDISSADQATIVNDFKAVNVQCRVG